MADIKLVVDTITGLQEENKRLKRVNRVLQNRVIVLEHNKPCKDCASNPISEYSNLENEIQFLKERIEKIKQIVNDYDGSTPSMIKQFSEIQKVLGKE